MRPAMRSNPQFSAYRAKGGNDYTAGAKRRPLTVLLVQQSERAEQTRDDAGTCGDQRAEQASAAKIAYEFCRHIKHKPCAHATENHFRYATKRKNLKKRPPRLRPWDKQKRPRQKRVKLEPVAGSSRPSASAVARNDGKSKMARRPARSRLGLSRPANSGARR